MKKLLCLASLFVGLAVSAMSASAASPEESELMSAAVDLGHRYDSYYATKDAVGMTSLYAPEGVLLTLSGKVVRGKAELERYYSDSFAAGAQGHVITVIEAHGTATGGFALARFSINVPDKDVGLRKVDGNLVAVLKHDASGWHLSLVAPSVPPSVPK